MAEQLLTRMELVIQGRSCRIIEVEFYYHGPGHFDPFTHCHPRQLTHLQWYLHRQGNSLRNGSFKGLDLTIGNGTGYGGVLIRGLESPEGGLIEGPSRVVDHFLEILNCNSVAALDGILSRLSPCEPRHAVHLRPQAQSLSHALYRTPRIGLTLRQQGQIQSRIRFLGHSYRFLTEPKKIRKGRALLALALLTNGVDAETISGLMAIRPGSLKNYQDAFLQGMTEPTFAPFVGRKLHVLDRCQFQGAWQAVMNG